MNVEAAAAIVEALEEAVEMACNAGTVETLDAQIVRAVAQLVHLRGALTDELHA